MRSLVRGLPVALVFLFVQAKAQVHIYFILEGKLPQDKLVFLAGNVNGWNPADSAFVFNEKRLTIAVKPGETVSFKLTLGSWNTVETDNLGHDIGNREIAVEKDTTVLLVPAGFKSEKAAMPKAHTASKTVGVLDTAFYMPQLKRSRTVRMYLPPDYSNSGKRYPVLYMADGQNCFDEATAPFGEWKVDEALDHFYDSCRKSMIVIAVDNSHRRLNEYDPYLFNMIDSAEGKLYAAFLAETLKPFVDAHYRTRPDATNTHIAGSSMGGVISMYVLAAYPNSFGNAGIFSPAFWTSRPLFDFVQSKLPKLAKHSIFFYAGGKEGDKMVEDTQIMFGLVNSKKEIKTAIYIDEAAKHNEAAWSKWFPQYLSFILQ